MPLFGGGSKKIKFDARQPPQDLQGYREYSFVHNFKVRYKKSILQIIENEVAVSITSSSAHLPSPETVSRQFNRQLPYRERHSSHHITSIDYKESFAMSYGIKKTPVPITVPVNQPHNPAVSHSTSSSITTISGFMFCTKCGTRLEASSRFCKSCGARQN